MNRRSFYYLLFIFFYNTSGYAAVLRASSDTSLDRVIIEKVVSPGYEKTGLIILKQSQNLNMADYLIKSKILMPLVFEYLDSDFNLVTRPLTEIVNEYKYFFDHSGIQAYGKVSFLEVDDKLDTWKVVENIRKKNSWTSVVTNLIILRDEVKGKCIVYYHVFQGGGTAAFLERRNQKWEVVKIKVQSLE